MGTKTPWEELLGAQDTFPRILSSMADAKPDQLFLHDALGGSLTWSQLQRDVEIWAARFSSLEVKREPPIATILNAGPEALAIWLGTASIGAVDASMSGQYRGRMLVNALNTVRPELVVVSHEYLPLLEEVATDLQTVTKVLVLDTGESVVHAETKLPSIMRVSELDYDVASARRRIVMPKWHDIACISFTSGTTGASKAVKMPWGQLHCSNLGTYPFEDLTPEDVFYCFVAHGHFGSKAIPYLAAMARGQVVIRPRFSLANFATDVTRFGITTTSLVGTMPDMLARNPDNFPDKTSLRNIYMAPLHATGMRFVERLGARVCTAYSSTENAIPISSGWNPSNARSLGRLRQGYPGFEVRIVDDNDFEVPDGTAGECIVRSAVQCTLNAGYLNDAEATSRAWRNGWYHTGDVLLRTGDGQYFYVDRMKDMARRRGENISCTEVEADVMVNTEVAECAVVAVPADMVEDELLLFVVRCAGSSMTPDDLCVDLERRMTRFMVPRYVEVVEALPKTTATERVIKSQLRERGITERTWDRELRSYVQRKEVTS